jgi:hypothetical protein
LSRSIGAETKWPPAGRSIETYPTGSVATAADVPTERKEEAESRAPARNKVGFIICFMVFLEEVESDSKFKINKEKEG